MKSGHKEQYRHAGMFAALIFSAIAAFGWTGPLLNAIDPKAVDPKETAEGLLVLRAQSNGNDEKSRQESAGETCKPGTESLLIADTLAERGRSALLRGDLDASEKCYSQALKIQMELAPASLALARSFNGLGNVAVNRGDPAKAEDYYRQALAIREKRAPSSLDVASSLNNLGIFSVNRGDLAKGEDYYNQALAIRKRWAPDSLEVAASLNNLGNVTWLRGDLAKAEEYHHQALALKQKLAPGSLDVAQSLNNLGNVAQDRGDLVKAEEYHRQSLAIKERVAPGSLDVAGSLTNLGNLVRVRGELDKAEDYYHQALALREKLAPGSLDVAAALNSLGNVARERGDLDKAEEYHLQALTIRQRLAPGSTSVAASLNGLGNVAWERAELGKAEDYYGQVLSIEEKVAPDGLDVAESLKELGDVARKRGDLAKAEQEYRRAIAIWERLAPDKQDYAETLAALAGILRRQGYGDAASTFFERALNVLENQMAHLGGAYEDRSNFRAKYHDYYRDSVDLLMARQQPEQALQVLERSRARTLLEMLTEGQIHVHRGIDAALLAEEYSVQSDISAKVNRRLQLLGRSHSEDQVTAIGKEIELLLQRYKQVESQIRASSPGYAALMQPRSLTAKEIQQQLLDVDTLLLEYSLGEERSYVWAVTPGSLTSYELPKRMDIEQAARKVYELLTTRNRPIKGETGLQRQARLVNAEVEYSEATAALSRMVLAPVEAQLKGKRLLIVCDGALQYIPFAVLPEPALMGRDKTNGHKIVPLIAHHEIVSLPSASVLSVLRQERIGRKRGTKAVAVLADPVFTRDDGRVNASAATRVQQGGTERGGNHEDAKVVAPAVTSTPSSTERLTRSVADVEMPTDGVYLPRLRFTRREAEAILAATPSGESMSALNFRASRLTATSPELAQYRVIHFATHGLLDSEHPELSGLVLSLFDKQGRQQNGFLDLQDIYNLNLPAELVVLSACETGLGKNVQGEGLVGLTRGFMYAGASRVVASLWRVDDVATAELMGRFYRAMEKDGMRPAAALRQAQMEMWKQKDWSSPYYWAAFQLHGEWK